MSLAPFLERLLSQGTIVHSEEPRVVPPDGRTLALVGAELARHRLDVPGAPIPFELETAVAAAEVVRRASWLLLHEDAEVGAPWSRLLSRPPSSPGEHLSADAFLRFGPQLLRRAASRPKLAAWLSTVLRRHPLSGILAPFEEPPLSSTDFGHAGLEMLYAERHARLPVPNEAWAPPASLEKLP